MIVAATVTRSTHLVVHLGRCDGQGTQARDPEQGDQEGQALQEEQVTPARP
ncbi:hypothetical protein SEA_JAMZY_6 [Gordonia phage Jamzy]|nr:hypothetical protein SEA_JAMZY_6 [Gordonia phage Jamzy]